MKALHRIFSMAVLAALLTSLMLISAAFAAEADLRRVPVGGRLVRFIDDKNLLTSAQAAELTAKLDEISERQQFDTVVAVVRSLKSGARKDREVRLYAADFYEQNWFGFGKDLDGAILLLATEDRDFGFAATGFGFKAFTPAGQEYLVKLFLPHLQSDRYFEAFMAYAAAVDGFVTKAKSGQPYIEDNIPITDSEIVEYRTWTVLGSLVLALLIAFSITGIWKRRLKTVRQEHLADAYIREGSLIVATRQDTFLYRNVHKTARPKNEGKGGGSFSSSSGRSYTGRSGKY